MSFTFHKVQRWHFFRCSWQVHNHLCDFSVFCDKIIHIGWFWPSCSKNKTWHFFETRCIGAMSAEMGAVQAASAFSPVASVFDWHLHRHVRDCRSLQSSSLAACAPYGITTVPQCCAGNVFRWHAHWRVFLLRFLGLQCRRLKFKSVSADDN